MAKVFLSVHLIKEADMKRQVLFIISTLILSLSSKGQLQHEQWKGNMDIPMSTLCLLDFKNDTATIYYAGEEMLNIPDANGQERMVTSKDSAIIEVMQYTIHGDSLFVQKIRGLSPCNLEGKGLYRIIHQDNKMHLILLSDQCADRGSALNDKVFEKIK